LKHCRHNYLITSQDVKLQSSADYVSVGPLSNYCSECWKQRGLEVPEPYKAELDNPFALGFCDLISQVARKRGFTPHSDALTDVESDLRTHLMSKQHAVERGIREEAEKQGIDPGDPALARNYIRNVLQNFLTDKQQKSRASKVIRNTTQSLSLEGLPVLTRQQESHQQAGEMLTDLTGGCAASEHDDNTLDQPDALFVDGPDRGKTKRVGRSEERRLFDTMLEQASSQIGHLTGKRTNGFDVNLDLRKALSKLPADENLVFSYRWTEDGEILARPKAYEEVSRDLNRTVQQIRTLEIRAVQKLKPILGPSFFKKRQVS